MADGVTAAGAITAVRGAVVDIGFAGGVLPPINDAVWIEAGDGRHATVTGHGKFTDAVAAWQPRLPETSEAT